MESLDLPFIWAAIIAFAVLAYVVLDGFDLGVGILFPFARKESERDDMMNSVAPVWDGNETWLVLGGGGLMAVFPLAYAIILPALYAPLTIMLLGLVFRGVAFEFRWRSTNTRWLWDLAFSGGSTAAALMQGIALGALVQGIPILGRAYSGGWWDWLTPFSLLTGLSVVLGYALLGSTWLIFKTEGSLQTLSYKLARFTALGTLAAIVAVSLVTPYLDVQYLFRWLGTPQIYFTALIPLLVTACGVILWYGIEQKQELSPFLAALGLFVLSYAGLGISFYPYIVPTSVTIWQAAAPDNSLAFLLVGTVFLIPLILAYTVYSYWIFRGKVHPSSSYH